MQAGTADLPNTSWQIRRPPPKVGSSLSITHKFSRLLVIVKHDKKTDTSNGNINAWNLTVLWWMISVQLKIQKFDLQCQSKYKVLIFYLYDHPEKLLYRKTVDKNFSARKISITTCWQQFNSLKFNILNLKFKNISAFLICDV